MKPEEKSAPGAEPKALMTSATPAMTTDPDNEHARRGRRDDAAERNDPCDKVDDAKRDHPAPLRSGRCERISRFLRVRRCHVGQQARSRVSDAEAASHDPAGCVAAADVRGETGVCGKRRHDGAISVTVRRLRRRTFQAYPTARPFSRARFLRPELPPRPRPIQYR